MPYSLPTRRIRSPISLSCSVGNGPPPTRVVYALTIPIQRSMCRVGTPEPAAIPAALLFELVTYGIAAVVDVEQRPLRPLEQEPLAPAERLVEPGRRVADERPEPLGVAEVLVGDGVGVERLEVGEHRREQPVLVGDDPAEVLAEPVGVVEVADPDAVDPADLVAVARADPAPGRAEVVGGRGRLLGQPLLGQVVGQDHVGPVADVQPAADVDPLRRPGSRPP